MKKVRVFQPATKQKKYSKYWNNGSNWFRTGENGPCFSSTEESKKQTRKRLYQLWLNDFDAWAENQRQNCERTIEKSREKWDKIQKITKDEIDFNQEFKDITNKRL